MTVEKITLIVNPKAGMDRKRLMPEDVVPAFKTEDNEITVRLTQRAGHAAEIAKECAPESDAIVCCGGDGTFNEVVNGVIEAGADIPLVYIPCGSTNDFANTLGIPGTPAEVAAMYRAGSVYAYDVGVLNGRAYTYVVSFGVAASLSYTTPQKFKNLFGHAAYMINGFVIHAIPILATLKPAKLKIEYDEGTLEGNFYFGAVSNTTKVAGLLNFDTCGVKLDDGKLEVILVKDVNAFNAVPIFRRIRRQDYSGDNLIMFKTEKLKITSEAPLDWTLDGEECKAGLVSDIGVLKRRIRVVSAKTDLLSAE